MMMSQSVAENTQVAKGTIVMLRVWMGAQPTGKVAVPNVYTYTKDDAIYALMSAGLNGQITGDEDGTAIATSPDAGTEVDPGTTVVLTLQHASTLVTVPDVSGLCGQDACAAMKAVGLDFDYDTNNPDMTVDSTSPAAGETVDQGTVIEAVYEPHDDSGDDVNTNAYVDNGSVDDSVDDTTQH